MSREDFFSIENSKKIDIFIAVFHLIKNASSSIHFTIDGEKLYIQGMDKSHICLFELVLDKEWFDTYSIQKTYNLSVDSNAFYSIISIKSDGQIFIVDFTKIQDNILQIEFTNKNNNETKHKDYNKYFKLPLMEYDYELLSIPTTEYDVEFVISSKKMMDVLHQLNYFGNDVFVNCNEKSSIFHTKDDIEMKVELTMDDFSDYSIVEDTQICVIYNLVYINKMCITNKLSTHIAFHISNEYPMKIMYNLGIKSNLTFYIAPKLAE
jgi:proliferating cell nuclear antigen PCNA